jgi:hypothetical protein
VAISYVRVHANRIHHHRAAPIREGSVGGAGDACQDQQRLLNAIRSDEAIKCDHMLGYYGVVSCEMSVTSHRERRYLKWDAAKEQIG